MELFTINRYTGDSPEIKIDESREDEMLKRLLEKAAQRKRKFEEECPEPQEEPIPIQIPETNEYIEEIKIDNEIEESEEIDEEPKIDNKLDEIIPNNNFQVLGDDVFKKKQNVEVVLPSWLAYPTIISKNICQDNETDLKNSLENYLYLSPQIMKNLKTMEIVKLFPVQHSVIPWILNVHSKPSPFRPRDICVSAPTGSGKTLAFAIPIVQLLENCVDRKIRALIVLPVNELALQVFKVFKNLAGQTSLSVCLLSKSFPFAIEQQQLVESFKGKFYSKVDIVITTPGRLVEHLHATKGFSLQHLKFLVIDEADRIMEQIHHNWLYHLDEHVKNTSDLFLSGRSAPLCLNELENGLKHQPHKLLFSATLSQDPEKLQNLRLFQPKLFTSVIQTTEELRTQLMKNINNEPDDTSLIRGEFIGKYTTPSELTEKFCLTESRLKPLTLYSLINENNWNKFLCFTNSADSAHRLAFVLDYMFKNERKISELSSTLNQKNRTTVLDLFSRGKINGLICSDALARGIDIPEVDIVISYDSPRHIKTYIHRIGRTARAGRIGTAITILAPNEIQKFHKTIAEGGKEISEEIKTEINIEEKFAKIYSNALRNLQQTLEHQKKMKLIHKSMTKSRALQSNNIDNDGKSLPLMSLLQNQAEKTMINKLKNLTENNNDGVKVSRKFRKKIKTKK